MLEIGSEMYWLTGCVASGFTSEAWFVCVCLGVYVCVCVSPGTEAVVGLVEALFRQASSIRPLGKAHSGGWISP